MPDSESFCSEQCPEIPQSSNMSVAIAIDPVSNEARQVFHLAVSVILCGLLSLFGMGTNIINIIVFAKQGFKESINVSLISLAVADLLTVVTMLWTSISASPLIANYALPFYGFGVSYVAGAWPHTCFTRVTSCITTFITLERCLCVTIPLKVKSTFTSTKTKVINVSIFAFNTCVFAPFFFVNNLTWLYHPHLNRSLVTLVQTEDRIPVEKYTFLIHSLILPVGCFTFVVVSTVVLVISLNRKSKWRNKATGNMNPQAETPSSKEKRVGKMVVLIATIFIGCYCPGMLLFVVMIGNTEFSFSGKFANMFVIMGTMPLVFQTLNSSVNIFVYWKMSSKFKTTCLELFAIFVKKG